MLFLPIFKLWKSFIQSNTTSNTWFHRTTVAYKWCLLRERCYIRNERNHIVYGLKFCYKTFHFIYFSFFFYLNKKHTRTHVKYIECLLGGNFFYQNLWIQSDLKPEPLNTTFSVPEFYLYVDFYFLVFVWLIFFDFYWGEKLKFNSAIVRTNAFHFMIKWKQQH